MTNNFNDVYKLFSLENNPVLDTARKAGEVTRDAFEGVAREQFAATGELVDLGVKQFEALSAARSFESVVDANQAWFNGSVEIVTAHAGKSFEILQDAAATLTAAPVAKKPAGKTTRKTAKKAA